MTDDRAVAIAALALQSSGRLAVGAVRDLLIGLRASPTAIGSVNEALERADTPRAAVNGSVAAAAESIDKGLAQGIAAIPISSEKYPVTLRAIADAPPVLFARGNLAMLPRLPGVAVVGTRKASPHGLKIAARIAEHISSEGWIVVSGLALGIDAAAHEGAILGGTPTIAVLAHGLEKANPAANRPLAQRILESGGVWLSEHPVGTHAQPSYFVLRNRIQVGLSCASVIVEGEERSGSATQAEYCLRSNRTLFAVVPEGAPNVKTTSELPRMLVKNRGAIPILSKEDYPAMMEQIAKSARVLTTNL